jgi:TolA-binding protein
MKYWYNLAAASLLIALFLACGQKFTEEQMRAQASDFEAKEQWAEAVKSYEKLAKAYPHSEKTSEDLYRLGMLYANQLKDFTKSVTAYQRLIENFPSSGLAVQSLFMIGYRYANDIKDLENAKKYYQEFLQKYPQHELASSVKWELDHLGQDISSIELQLGKKENTNAK